MEGGFLFFLQLLERLGVHIVWRTYGLGRSWGGGVRKVPNHEMVEKI